MNTKTVFTMNEKQLTSIPHELQAYAQWVVWRIQDRDGKPTKVPFQTNNLNAHAKCNDPKTWSVFKETIPTVQRNPTVGLGFVFSQEDPFTGIDLDKCRDPQTGKLDPWAEQIVTDLNSYTEVSPSGTGVHILVKGKLPPGSRRKGQIEMYESHRFFCMTGQHMPETPQSIESRQAQLDTLHSQVFPKRGPELGERNELPLNTSGSMLSDDELLLKARQSKHGKAFKQLYEGYWQDRYRSQSEADLALCGQLAFWTGGHLEQMDRLFRASGLMRSKWDERHYADGRTYGQGVLNRAFEETRGVYRGDNPNGTKKKKASPADLAEQFLRVSNLRPAEGLHLRWYREEWFKFDGRIFVVLPLQDLRAEIMKFIQHSPFRDQANQTVVKNILVNLEAFCLIPSRGTFPAAQVNGKWVECPNKLVFLNGVVDLGDLIQGEANPEIQPHSPHLVSTIGLPFTYDQQAQCPQWQTFLQQILPDIDARQLLQEIFGYCLTPDTSLQKFFLFEGSGGNGKSVVLRVLTMLLGPDNVSSLPLELFGATHSLEVTLGKLANLTTDIGEMDRIAEGLLKQFTGEDLMFINPKYRKPFSAKPTAKLIMAANIRPPFRDKSEGIWRRLMILPFPITIPEEKRDAHLTDKLMKEMPGIMIWAIDGAQRLRRRGKFEEPLCSKVARKEFQLEANPARQYLVENYRELTEKEIKEDPVGLWDIEVEDLYLGYLVHCKRGKLHPLGQSNFGKEVFRAFPTVKRVRRAYGSNGFRPWMYRGIVCDYGKNREAQPEVS